MAGVKHFRTNLEGVSFQIENDHNPLTHLSTLRESHGRLARWALTLQPYRFKMVHRAGTANTNADGLSRVQGSRQVSGEPLKMIEIIKLPEVVNGKVQDVVVRDNGSSHVPTREPEAELLIDSPNTSRHLIGCQGGYQDRG